MRHETDRGVDGTNARGSIAMPRSSPKAAQRCAEGAGLDGDDRGRSTIKCAVPRAAAHTELHRRHGSDRLLAYITNLHQLDGRGPELAELAGAAGLRWTIEECFQRAKEELGLDHCEARSWHGWHRHMTLCMAAAAFLARLAAQLRQAAGSKANERSPVPLAA